jgi:hypothetical protein
MVYSRRAYCTRGSVNSVKGKVISWGICGSVKVGRKIKMMERKPKIRTMDFERSIKKYTGIRRNGIMG